MQRRLAQRRGDQGASAVEYGLLVVAIAALIVAVVVALGTNVFDLFDRSCNNFQAEASTAATCS